MTHSLWAGLDILQGGSTSFTISLSKARKQQGDHWKWLMPARVSSGCSPMQFLAYTIWQHCLIDVVMNMDHTGEAIQDRLVDGHTALDRPQDEKLPFARHAW